MIGGTLVDYMYFKETKTAHVLVKDNDYTDTVIVKFEIEPHIEGGLETGASARRRLVGEPIEIILSNASFWDVFEPGNTVETALGIGEVTKDDYDTLTCRLSLNVRY